MLGIFYIATGVYTEYFEKFIESVHFIFPNHLKKIIVISDGLKEYDNMCINGNNIYVEDIIDYPYPMINLTKFQIVNKYAKKHKIDKIVYFDAETYFIKNDEYDYDALFKKMESNKLISLCPLYYSKYTFRDAIYLINNYSYFGHNYFDDYDFFYNGDYDNIDVNYKWIQTSFFMCNNIVLDKIDTILQDFISYNLRVMGCKLNYSDEFFINYLNLYYPEYFECDFYTYNNEDTDFINQPTSFFYQKYKTTNKKYRRKFGNSNYNFIVTLLNNKDINDESSFHKFFIKNHNKCLIWSYGNNDIKSKIFIGFFDKLWDYWFDGNHNIILCDSFYDDEYFYNYKSTKEHMCIGFVHKIDDSTINFDYDDFYNNDYDYIEGRNFDDLSKINFYDIDICCFSKRYIDAYFNNEKIDNLKVYKYDKNNIKNKTIF